MAIFWQGPDCGSHTRWELTNWADFQLCLRRLLVSTGCKSRHNGFLDVSCSNGGLKISGWIGQLSCLTIFSTRLSVAAFLRRAGGSMFLLTHYFRVLVTWQPRNRGKEQMIYLWLFHEAFHEFSMGFRCGDWVIMSPIGPHMHHGVTRGLGG